jgi:glucosylceramidase
MIIAWESPLNGKFPVAQPGNLNNVAFKRADGKIVLIVENDGGAPETFNIKINGKIATTSLDAGAVATYIF